MNRKMTCSWHTVARTVYVNVYGKSPEQSTGSNEACGFDTEQRARDNAQGNFVPVLAVAVPVTITE
jgi:hypothetical protein